MPGTVVGRQPSPRALIHGFEDKNGDSDAAVVAALFPTARWIDSLDEVQQGEFDVLITKAFPSDAEPHLFVVAVGGTGYAQAQPPDSMPLPSVWEAWVNVRGYSKAREFVVPPELPKAFERLVYGDLLPLCEQRAKEQALPYLSLQTAYLTGVNDFDVLRPLITTTEPAILAALFRRKGGLAECLALPDGVDIAAWTAAAVETWRDVDPERFPVPPAWKHAETWMTRVERERADELADVDREWQEAQVSFAERRVAAEKALAQARQEADAHQRRLLVAQGEHLVTAVSQALEAIGFDVRNMDAVWPENDRREDLRVSSADHPGWIAIVEVRGYVRGATLNDLLRIASRFVPRYMQDEGSVPSAAWYIVNHNVRRDPSQRPRVLAGNDPEIETFAKGAAPGLVIDTETVFRVLNAVDSGLVEAATVREALISQMGIFRWTQS